MKGQSTSRLELERLEDRTVPSVVAFDITGRGLFRWTDGNFQQVGTADNSTNLDVNRDGVIAASYGTGRGGTLWRITGTNWQPFGTAAPISLKIAHNNWIAASFDFDGGSVWRIDPNLNWQELSSLSPTLRNHIASQVGVTENGDVIADFDTLGLWRFSNSTGWVQLTTADPSVIAVSDEGWIVGAFGDKGTWRISRERNWQLVVPGIAVPSQLDIDDDGEIVGDFDARGLWLIEDGDDWRQLTTADAANVGLGITEDEDAAADLTGRGIFLLDEDGHFNQLTNIDAHHLAAN